MAGILTTSSMLMCPHGGTVSVISSNTHARAAGDFILRSSDTFVIAGCPLNVSGVLHPCVQIQWVQPDTRSKAAGDFTLSQQSVGLCVAGDKAVQGTATITSTQAKVSGI